MNDYLNFCLRHSHDLGVFFGVVSLGAAIVATSIGLSRRPLAGILASALPKPPDVN